nr:PWWP domain-containing protein 3-like isoform X2 [Lolium perenne]
MASRGKNPPGDEGAPIPTRPARVRVIRPEVEEVLRSPRRGRPKLHQQHSEDDNGAAPPRYDCAFQAEKEGLSGEFAPPDMVWCKVKSHPWWPAQVFDAADASERALQHARSGGGAPLVAYFWDKTFAWSDPAALLPFRANFARLAGQNTIFNYVSAVHTALEEVERRVEAGLSCACVPNARKRQEVQNSGVREGAYGAVVDDAYMRDTFHAKPFVDYIAALASSPLAGADRLDLATAKAQLRSFNRLRGPRELPEFVTFQGIEDVPTETTTPNTKRKRTEDDVPSKEKKPRNGGSSLRKRKEKAVDEESPVPRKSAARKKTSKDVEKTESHVKKDVMVEDSSKQTKSKIRSSKSSAEKKKKIDSSKDTDKGESLPEPAEEGAANEGSSMPSGEETDGKLSKGRKSKISKSSAKMKKKGISKDTDKKESVPEPAVEDATNEDSNMPSGGATDGTLSKEMKSKISKSSAKMKKKDISKDADKKESVPEPAEEDATNEDSNMPSGGATDGTLSKRRKSNISKSSAKTKKKDASKNADKKESPPEPAVEDATNDESSMPSGEAIDGALIKGRKSKISKGSTKTKKKDISKDADKKKSLPDPAKEEATGDDSSTPRSTDGTVSKKRNSKVSKSPVKKKQDTSKDTDGVETVGGSKTPVKKTVDGILTESKSERRLRSMHKTEDASEGSKGPMKDDVGETTKGKDKDAALLKENNLGRRASSARQNDKITADGDGLADSSVKESASPRKKKPQLGETSATKDAPISISEHGRKRKKVSELMAETSTPNRSPGGKSKAQGKRSLPALTEKPDETDRDPEDTVKTRGKRSLPASTEKSEDPGRDPKGTMKIRGKLSLPASAEKCENPDRDTKDTMKTRGKRSLPKSTEEPDDPDRDTKDTMETRKRKKIDTLGDLSSQPQPLSPKRPTKVREVMPKAAGKKSQTSSVVKANDVTLGDLSSQPQPLSPKRSTRSREATRQAAELKPHTSPAVEANGEASQTRSRRAKTSEETVPDKSPRPVKPNKGKKGATTEDSLSCGEMHSQLRLAASDLKKVGKITPASVSFFTEFSKSSCPSSSDVEKEIPVQAANTDSYASSPHADEQMPEEAANKVASPAADVEIPEKAANKVASPPADEEIPERAANKVASPRTEEIPEKVANSEPSPSELPVADHMKDDYWADILINVEEPISSLKKKKDKSKSKTSKTKELQAEDAATKEPSVSMGNVEEPNKKAESKQDTMENGEAEVKPPSVANGGQPKAEETTENLPLVGLVLHFTRPDAVPSHSDLIKIFSQYGPVSEARTQTGNTTNSATVIFKRRMDAEGAFGSAGKMTSVLGPGLASFRLTDFPSSGGGAAASGNRPRQGASE